MSKPVKLVYNGPMSKFDIPEIGIFEQKRGEPFLVPASFADQVTKRDPKKWEVVGGSVRSDADASDKKKGGGK